jgi:hypothetical protein
MKFQGIFHFNLQAKKGWKPKAAGVNQKHQNRLGFVEKALL